MTFDQIIDKLRAEAHKSDIAHKHACVAIRKGKLISPTFHNYIRMYIYDYKCGSAHAEMVTMNYLLNSQYRERWCEKQSCILSAPT